MGVAAFIPLIGDVFDRIFPDKEKANEAKLRLFELEQQGQLAELDAKTQLALGQLEVNKAEASGTNMMARTWRPAVGWICALGFGWAYLVQPMFVWGVYLSGSSIDSVPQVNIEGMMPVLLGMLGLGLMRTAEKTKGVARN